MTYRVTVKTADGAQEMSAEAGTLPLKACFANGVVVEVMEAAPDVKPPTMPRKYSRRPAPTAAPMPEADIPDGLRR